MMKRSIYITRYKEPLAGGIITCRYIAENIHQVNRYVEDYLHGEIMSIECEAGCICIMDNMFPPVDKESIGYVWTKIPDPAARK